MFVAPGAGGAVGPNARFTDFSQRALDGGPELLELAEKVLAERRIGGFRVLHLVCISTNIHTGQEKIEKITGALISRHH